MLKNIVLLLFLLFASAQLFASEELVDFETDYCTMFEDGTPSKPMVWKQCCYDHDLRFWFGGSETQRDLADLRLKSCVENTGHQHIAKLMYYAVRAGRYSPVQHKLRWGWGWKPFIGYKDLSLEQKMTVKKKLNQLKLEPAYLKEFLNFYNL